MSTPFKEKFLNVPHIHSTNVFKEIGRNAYVDWLFILFINVTIATVLILGGIYLYWKVSTGNFDSSSQESQGKEAGFKQKELDTLINKFKSKELNREQVKAGYRGPSDPTL